MDYLCIKCKKILDEETEIMGELEALDQGIRMKWSPWKDSCRGFGWMCKECHHEVYEMFDLEGKCGRRIAFFQNILNAYEEVTQNGT